MSEFIDVFKSGLSSFFRTAKEGEDNEEETDENESNQQEEESSRRRNGKNQVEGKLSFEQNISFISLLESLTNVAAT